MAILQESWVNKILADANTAAGRNDHVGVTRALRGLPVEMYIALFIDPLPAEFAQLQAWLPAMPPEQDQRAWAGNVGMYLMQQGAVFLDKMMDVYQRGQPRDLDRVRVLDYGCGWGRLMRIMYRYVPATNITGVDPWDESLKRCQAHGVWGELKQIDYVPRSLPLRAPFDVIFAYSVFTHISLRSQQAVLAALRKIIDPNGLLAVTIRQENYWRGVVQWPEAEKRAELMQQHKSEGFAYIPHSNNPDYGDTSMTLDFIRRNWTDWTITDVDWRMVDEYQTYVFLKPA